MNRISDKSMHFQRGAVLVEMALVTPILLVLLLATADLTRAFIEHNTLTKSLRNGARYAAANAFQGTTGTVTIDVALENEIRNLVVFGSSAPPAGAQAVMAGLTTTNVTVTQIVGTNDIEISATYTLGGLLGPVLPSFYGGSGISTTRALSATVTMSAL
jgi:Flp pilus assembly protein TadG